MEILTTAKAISTYVETLRSQSLSIALVPTMGALHEGHVSLVKLAHQHGKRVIVSIFVNPTQFGDPNDLAKYPRTLDRDCELLSKYGVAAVFAPATPAEIYGENFQSWVTVEGLSSILEGASRPGHFRGVATVVNLLLNITRADSAIFGEKDFQQVRVVEQMVSDLKLPTRIVRAPLVRDPDGLALSSRNVRLSTAGRVSALAISRGLRIARDAYLGSERRASKLRELVLEAMTAESGVSPDYVAIVDELTLKPVELLSGSGRILVAAVVEGVRLIDNIGIAS